MGEPDSVVIQVPEDLVSDMMRWGMARKGEDGIPEIASPFKEWLDTYLARKLAELMESPANRQKYHFSCEP